MGEWRKGLPRKVNHKVGFYFGTVEMPMDGRKMVANVKRSDEAPSG